MFPLPHAFIPYVMCMCFKAQYNDLNALCGIQCFTLLIAKMAILELIIFICSFHVKCLFIYSPRNFTLFFFVLAYLVNNFIVYFNATVCFAVGVYLAKTQIKSF